MSVSCSVCLLAAAIVSEYGEASGQTFWLCPACWTDDLHGLDETTAAQETPAAAQVAVEVVPGGEWVGPRGQHRRQAAS
jgi:hypothetical protein